MVSRTASISSDIFPKPCCHHPRPAYQLPEWGSPYASVSILYTHSISILIIILTSNQLSMTQTILTSTVPPLLRPLSFLFCSLAQPSSTSTKLLHTGKPSVGSLLWADCGKHCLLLLVFSQFITLRKRGRTMPLFYCSFFHHY
jgi:hypothetical protein